MHPLEADPVTEGLAVGKYEFLKKTKKSKGKAQVPYAVRNTNTALTPHAGQNQGHHSQNM